MDRKVGSGARVNIEKLQVRNDNGLPWPEFVALIKALDFGMPPNIKKVFEEDEAQGIITVGLGDGLDG